MMSDWTESRWYSRMGGASPNGQAKDVSHWHWARMGVAAVGLGIMPGLGRRNRYRQLASGRKVNILDQLSLLWEVYNKVCWNGQRSSRRTAPSAPGCLAMEQKKQCLQPKSVSNLVVLLAWARMEHFW